jgi:hypothetical protein
LAACISVFRKFRTEYKTSRPIVNKASETVVKVILPPILLELSRSLAKKELGITQYYK